MAGEITFFFNTDEEGNIIDSTALDGVSTPELAEEYSKFEHSVVVDSWKIPIDADILQYKEGEFIYKSDPNEKRFKEATPPPLDSYFEKNTEPEKDETV